MHEEEVHNPPKALWPSLTVGLLMILFFWLGTKALLELPEPAPAEDAARSAERAKAYEDMQSENAARLTQFGWADREKGNVQIPIDLAMNLTVNRLKGQIPAPAGSVNPPVPAPAAPAQPAPPTPPAAEQAEVAAAAPAAVGAETAPMDPPQPAATPAEQ